MRKHVEGNTGNTLKYRAIFFDAGNTLLRPYPSVHDVCTEVFHRNGFHAEEDDIKRAVTSGDRYYEERYWRDDTFWRSEAEAKALWIDLYSLVAAELGINGNRRHLANEIYDEFGLHHRWELFHDVEPVLNELKEDGMKLGIISNWDTRLSGICARLGLSDYFDFIISSASVGRFKPDPEIFKMGLARAGVSPEQAVHVGDHYYADILGARSAGVTPVLIDRAKRSGNIDCMRIDDMGSLLEFIDNGIF
jgi:putative hydrolase of the HAD superfamily